MARQRRRPSTGMFEAAQLMWAQEEAVRNPKPPVVTPRQESPEEKSSRKRRELSEAYERDFFARKAKEDAESKAAQARGAAQELLRALGATSEERTLLAECPLDNIPTALAEERRNAFLKPAREIKFCECRATPKERTLLARAEPDAIPQILTDMRRAVAAEDAKRASLGMYGILLNRK